MMIQRYYSYIQRLTSLTVSIFILGLLPTSVLAADCVFGNLEVPFGGIDSDICTFVDRDKPLLTYASLVIELVTGIVVVVGLISIVVGGYFYMTAGGDASRIQLGKTFIIAALSGIMLALIAYTILNALHPQFGDELREPVVYTSSAAPSRRMPQV